jgi:hypothetical protein
MISTYCIVNGLDLVILAKMPFEIKESENILKIAQSKSTRDKRRQDETNNVGTEATTATIARCRLPEPIRSTENYVQYV